MTPRTGRRMSRVRHDAAHRAFPLLDQLRSRRSPVADFDALVAALILARVQGWKDADAAAKKLERDVLQSHGSYGVAGLSGLRSELRRLIREAK